MLILHGIYDNGKIEILDKDLPMIKGDVEIKIKQKSWKRKIEPVEVKGEPVSTTIVNARYEE